MNSNNNHGYIYVFNDTQKKMFKIGYAKYPSQRLKQCQTGNAGKIAEVCRIATNDMKSLEKELHRLYAHRRVAGEWFQLTWDDLAELRAMAY
jgi:hypothetical protein